MKVHLAFSVRGFTPDSTITGHVCGREHRNNDCENNVTTDHAAVTCKLCLAVIADPTHWRHKKYVARQTCDCTTTMGREGEKGSWCTRCGVKVWEVHDRPCQECAHARDLSTKFVPDWICAFHTMRITANMLVTYRIGAPAGEHHGGGLCFLAKPAQAHSEGHVTDQ